MRGRKRRSFDFGNFEITKREILVSVSIVAIMLLIGVLIAGKISDYQLDKNEKYNVRTVPIMIPASIHMIIPGSSVKQTTI